MSAASYLLAQTEMAGIGASCLQITNDEVKLL